MYILYIYVHEYMDWADGFKLCDPEQTGGDIDNLLPILPYGQIDLNSVIQNKQVEGLATYCLGPMLPLSAD